MTNNFKSSWFYFHSWSDIDNRLKKLAGKSIAIYSLAFILSAIVVPINFMQPTQSQNGLPIEFSTSNISSNIINDNQCPDGKKQYEVTLSDSIVSDPGALESTIVQLNMKLNNSGIKVVDILENIGVLVITSENQRIIEKAVDDLRSDPRVVSVELSSCVKIFSYQLKLSRDTQKHM
jgi:hypothetical protein